MKIKNKRDISISILIHIGMLAAFAGFSFITLPKAQDLSYVEVSFGLNQNLVQTRQDTSTKAPEGEQEALKAKDALPQLTKQAAPNIAKNSEPKEDALKFKEPTKESENKTKTEEKNKDKAKLQANKTGKLETKDFLKRKEEELRKEGKKEQTGQKNVEPEKKIGQKHSLDNLPKSPFESTQAENAPVSAAPTGDETGQNTKAVDAYKMYLRGQLKQHWELSDSSKFSSSLITIVSFTVNEYGDLIGTPKIVESSRDAEFDKLVIEAVGATFPVSNPPPKDIKPPQTFLAKYNSKDVK